MINDIQKYIRIITESEVRGDPFAWNLLKGRILKYLQSHGLPPSEISEMYERSNIAQYIIDYKTGKDKKDELANTIVELNRICGDWAEISGEYYDPLELNRSDDDEYEEGEYEKEIQDYFDAHPNERYFTIIVVYSEKEIWENTIKRVLEWVKARNLPLTNSKIGPGRSLRLEFDVNKLIQYFKQNKEHEYGLFDEKMTKETGCRMKSNSDLGSAHFDKRPYQVTVGPPY